MKYGSSAQLNYLTPRVLVLQFIAMIYLFFALPTTLQCLTPVLMEPLFTSVAVLMVSDLSTRTFSFPRVFTLIRVFSALLALCQFGEFVVFVCPYISRRALQEACYCGAHNLSYFTGLVILSMKLFLCMDYSLIAAWSMLYP